MFVFGKFWHGKKGSTHECFAHSRLMNASDLRTSATVMSCIADVVSSIRLLARGWVLVSTAGKMPFDLTEAMAQVSDDEREAMHAKIDLVHMAQRRLGMEPRNDSRLTYNFARGLLDDDDVPSSIASELFVVEKIHSETNYSLIIEDVLRAIAKHVKEKYKIPWTNAWEIVRFYGPTMLKLYCIKTCA